ncbi:MAG: hypothetical protein KKG03_02580 [Gammaproteobacteria bacterium]|nr:hypothetical protein [Sideroxydans sp.]MBU3902724.1 hypothetical protein [Gammaproteobacteria bacterium]MBU4046282.1 hypothetical protein [Gammaproteobacteria bacterium]MBU4150517.1 hypothetical protein [Gammaproteobacteria bacterium]
MQKLSAHIETAAAEYRQETGKDELAPLWSAEYFQDCGVMDDYPGLSLIEFHALVQKALTLNAEREEKRARLEQDKHKRAVKK